jgi:hypothetical protein
MFNVWEKDAFIGYFFENISQQKEKEFYFLQGQAENVRRSFIMAVNVLQGSLNFWTKLSSLG